LVIHWIHVSHRRLVEMLLMSNAIVRGNAFQYSTNPPAN
jgi:hypothetical protein